MHDDDEEDNGNARRLLLLNIDTIILELLLVPFLVAAKTLRSESSVRVSGGGKNISFWNSWWIWLLLLLLFLCFVLVRFVVVEAQAVSSDVRSDYHDR